VLQQAGRTTKQGGRLKVGVIKMKLVLSYSPTPGDYLAPTTIATCPSPDKFERDQWDYPCHATCRGSGVYTGDIYSTVVYNELSVSGTAHNAQFFECGGGAVI
jgi:hypothetical protein